jgi:hypothetical protein
MAYDGDNPRVLWIKGGLQMVVPPASGGDWTKAAVTLRKGRGRRLARGQCPGTRVTLGTDGGVGRRT